VAISLRLVRDRADLAQTAGTDVSIGTLIRKFEETEQLALQVCPSNLWLWSIMDDNQITSG
jgi:hypothetical protein